MKPDRADLPDAGTSAHCLFGDVHIDLGNNNDDELRCRRCGDPALLTVRVPSTTPTADGPVTTYRTLQLCAHCSRDDAGAPELLALFHLHGRIDRDTVQLAARLIRQWIDDLLARSARYIDSDFDEEIQLWESGNM